MKAYVFDPLWPSLISTDNQEHLKVNGVQVVNVTTGSALSDCPDLFADTDDKILAINPDYVGWKLPANAFDRIQNLKCIITQSTSFGWVDTEFAKVNNIPVCNIRNFSTDAVAEWAVMMMLNVVRRIPLLIKDGFPLNYASDFQTYQGMNLKDKTAGIIGLGNIGQAIATRCAGMGMRVQYWNRMPKQTEFEYQELQTILLESDVIFPTMADNDETNHLITDDMLQAIKPGAIFISVVHQYNAHPLLLDMVKNNRLFGYGFEADPAAFNTFDGNVWAAPKYAWCTDGSMRKAMDLFVKAIANAACGHFPTRVN